MRLFKLRDAVQCLVRGMQESCRHGGSLQRGKEENWNVLYDTALRV